MSVRVPVEYHAVVGGILEDGGVDGVALVGIGRADDDEAGGHTSLTQHVGGLEQLDDALLANQSADDEAHDFSSAMPHSERSCVRAAAGIASGSKRLRSTPLPSRRTLRAGMCSVSTRVSTSSGFWTSSMSPNAAAMRSAAYTGIRRCQRSVGCAHRPCWVLTTSGVLVSRRGDPAEDARLGIVGVHDVGAQRVEQPQELAECAQVVERIVRTGERGHVDVPDAQSVEVGDVRPGRRHADHLVAGSLRMPAVAARATSRGSCRWS